MILTYSWDQVVAWLGLVVPLFALAWSAYQWVGIQREQQREKHFERFFETILRVHNSDKSLISQKAAVFELRNYPGYRALVARICESPEVYFPNMPEALKIEFQETLKAINR
ncbi:MAG: hypothetical protein CVT85_03415 [Alphaproteobacteria bacterium HGW-Alphaproteobacteria-7]|jgi:hypothetical protein|nr:MAG: hypothetical protein CVT85_03415 [Alphaproteobacteria bacterium HGW-Alphaproteobacteria-7]